jgi:hypothetical protein
LGRAGFLFFFKKKEESGSEIECETVLSGRRAVEIAKERKS